MSENLESYFMHYEEIIRRSHCTTVSRKGVAQTTLKLPIISIILTRNLFYNINYALYPS